MKHIPLTRGMVAIVDDEDLPLVDGKKWYAQRGGKSFYAAIRNPNEMIFMHRFLNPGWQEVDHRNGDGLDNRRSNLREATKSTNGMNRGANKGGASKFKGVSWDSGRHLWKSQICKDRKRVQLGRFDSEIEAAKAYDTAAKELHGEFAWTNFK